MFSASFAQFADEGLARSIPIAAFRRLVLAWKVDGEIVWGATAKILASIARRVVPDQP